MCIKEEIHLIIKSDMKSVVQNLILLFLHVRQRLLSRVFGLTVIRARAARRVTTRVASLARAGTDINFI